MKQISSIDLIYLTKELQILKNQRIETFYYENKTFYIKIFIKQLGNKFLTINLGKYIYLGTKKEESAHPNPFIQFLRKYVKSSFIEKIEQINQERILKLTISKNKIDENQKTKEITKTQKNYNLYLELFGNGNIILTNTDNQILNSLTKKTFKDRTIKIKQTYELPPANPLNIQNINQQILKTEIKNTNLPLVKFLAIKFGLGGKFAEYICEQTKIKNSTQTNTLNKTQIKTITKELENLKNHQIEAHTTKNNTDFYPINFHKPNQQKYKTFNQTLIQYFNQFKTETDPKEKEFEKELNKLKKRIQKQQAQKQEILKSYEKFNDIGNKIYEHYTQINELLKSINTAAKTKGWKHIQQTIKNNEKLSTLIKKLDYNKDKITLKLK